MARTSGLNIFSLAGTFSGAEIFGNVVQFNQSVTLLSALVLSSTLRTTTTTLGGGTIVNRCDTSGGAFTLSLPAGPIAGQIYIIKLISSGVNALTISGNGHNIDGAASLTLNTQYQSVVVRYDTTASTWDVLAQVATTIL